MALVVLIPRFVFHHQRRIVWRRGHYALLAFRADLALTSKSDEDTPTATQTLKHACLSNNTYVARHATRANSKLAPIQ